MYIDVYGTTNKGALWLGSHFGVCGTPPLVCALMTKRASPPCFPWTSNHGTFCGPSGLAN